MIKFTNNHSPQAEAVEDQPKTAQSGNLIESFAYFDVTTSVLALFGNTVVAIAIKRAKFHLTGYRRFLLSRTAADIFMATVYILYFLHERPAFSQHQSKLVETCGNNILRSLSFVGYFASLFSMGGLAADNFFGIFRPLEYKPMMEGGRLTRAIVILWVLSVLLAFCDFPVSVAVYLTRTKNQPSTNESSIIPPIDEANLVNILSEIREDATPLEAWETGSGNASALLHNVVEDVMQAMARNLQDDDWCSYYASRRFGTEFFVIGLTIVCFLLLIIIYSCIFVKVLRRRFSRPRNAFRQVFTTLLLIGSFSFFWMPLICFELCMYLPTSWSDANSQRGGAKSNQALVANLVLNSMLMLSPLFNPVIYSFRMKRVRAQVTSLLASLFCPCCHRVAKLRSSENSGTIYSCNSNTTFNRKGSAYLGSNCPSPDHSASGSRRASFRRIGDNSAVFTGCAGSQNLDYRCCVLGCDALFLTEAPFLRHIRSKHNDTVAVCESCNAIHYLDQKHVCAIKESNFISLLQARDPLRMTLSSL